MLMVDFKINKFKIVCNAIKNDSKTMECEIPEKLVQTIRETKKFQICVSLFIGTGGTWGVGLVNM